MCKEIYPSDSFQWNRWIHELTLQLILKCETRCLHIIHPIILRTTTPATMTPTQLKPLLASVSRSEGNVVVGCCWYSYLRSELHLSSLGVFSLLSRSWLPILVLPLHHTNSPQLHSIRMWRNRWNIKSRPHNVWKSSMRAYNL